MYERHENEQYFFANFTRQQLAELAMGYGFPCCLCAPTLGQELVRRGREVRILDIDTRFDTVPGFRHWDLYRPEWLGEAFGLIICDPPFFNVSLSQLFAALRTLARNDFGQPLLLSYLKRRETSVLGTFARFQLQPTGIVAEYQTVQPCERNEIEFYSNLPEEVLAELQ